METPSTAGDLFASRPAGGTELSWCRAISGGTGVTVLALQLSRPIPLPLLRSTFRRLQRSSPLLRAHLPSAAAAAAARPPPILISHSLTIDIEVIPSGRLLQIATSADASPATLFHSLIEREMNRNPWAESTVDAPVKAMFVTVYEMAEPGQSVLVIRLHTGACDRTAGVAILKGLIDMVARGCEEDVEEDEEGEVVWALEDLIRKEDAWKPIWARGKDLIGYSLNGLRSACLRFEDTGSNRRSELVKLVMDAEATQKLLAVCNANGVKPCAALTAAGLLASHASKNLQNNKPETYTILTLVDCRKYLNPPPKDEQIGFYHSAILNTHTIYGNENFWEITKRCHNAISSAKKNKKHLSDIGQLNFLMCKAIENPSLTPSSSLRTALFSIFEEFIDYDSAFGQLQGLGIDDFMGCASTHGIGASVGIFEGIRNGQIDCSLIYPSPLHSRRQMVALVDEMKKLMVEGCLVGGEAN